MKKNMFMPTADRYFFLFNGNSKDPLVFRWKITAAGKTQINLSITRTTFSFALTNKKNVLKFGN
jgi:hypothetical protein